MFSDSSADRSSPGWLDCDWLIEISNVFNWDHNLFEINCGIHYKGIVWCSISNGGCAEGTDLRFDTTLRALPTGSGHSAAEIEWSMIMCRPNVVNRMISFLNTLHFGLCHSRHWLILVDKQTWWAFGQAGDQTYRYVWPGDGDRRPSSIPYSHQNWKLTWCVSNRFA